jgi:GTPase SAR1 family protein
MPPPTLTEVLDRAEREQWPRLALLRPRAQQSEARGRLDETEKIRIDTWTLPSRHEGERLRVNIWDFGGQEIMHATHQFFLTKRSVYVLVIDARQGEIEGNIHYWLQTIQSFGGDSPVIVVTNKRDVQPLSLNENGLRRQYEPMKIAFHSVSCSTLAGIDGLKEALVATIQGLAHVDDELPESYFNVKAALEEAALKQHYVDMPEYARLCKAQGVDEEREQRGLLRVLHDLGTVLNFDDPDSPYQVGDTNILNPEWVTQGVYAIINNQPLMQAQGRLERKRLPEILSDPEKYPRDKQRFIVEMMRKFELCFDYADRPDTLLVPELLSKNEPDVNWKDAGECLDFEYGYQVLPSGLLPRFIVRMAHALTDKPTFWRSGVVLSIDGCKVLVRGDSRAKAVRVSVDGPAETRRSALATVRDQFKAIHETIPRLEVEERVPLPDVPTVTVPYEHLRKLEAASRTDPALDKYCPPGLPGDEVRVYSARQLLGGVDASFAHAAPPPPSPAPIEAVAQKPEPQQGDVERLGRLARIFFGLLAGSGVVIIAELRFLDDWSSRVAALVVTVLLSVVAFVFLGYFSGRMKGPMAERLLGGVMAKVPPLGQRGGSRAEAKGALAEPKPKGPKPALPGPAKALEAPKLEAGPASEKATGKPAKRSAPKKRG